MRTANTPTPALPTTSHLPDDFVNAEEAGRILRVSKWTIYEWIARGYFPHYRFGRLLRIRRVDLLERIQKERRSGAVPPDFEVGS
ncbi:hypothetical protein A3D73_01795 [Candidatus Uhrbacteria bacterium RIFCSPHIGHO2_02_FULL_60_44]|nr:MAG: hypothetical protein A3D73_01795 [Candidatus Uhrbacteria bacterium RIFCSPHIGHO2_02_FULL_60_44]